MKNLLLNKIFTLFSMHKWVILKKAGLYGVLIALAIVMGLPFYWATITSLKTPPDIISLPPTWIPNPVTLANYATAWIIVPFLNYYINTCIVSFTATFSAVFLSSLAGFAFAKYSFKGKEFFFILIISTLMMPFQITMIPLYMLMASLRSIDTYQVLIFPSISSAFGVFLMRQYITTAPNELIDAARIDGCSEFGIFLKIILPICKPAVATLSIFLFIGMWNDFLWPLIAINTPEMRTLSLGLAVFQIPDAQTFFFGPLMAATMFVVIPIIIFFIFAQKHVIKGFVQSGIKF